jgi:hypothetical protein
MEREDNALWSLSDDPDLPEPILGRADFKEALLAMFDPGASQRVMIVTEDPTDAAVGKTGKSFSVGHVPDFVREHALQYKQDVVSWSNIGVEAWKACIRAALISFGTDEQSYDKKEIGKIAELMFDFAKDRWIDANDPALALKRWGRERPTPSKF